MILTIDQSRGDPLYRQIRDRIVEGIATGELQEGDALPSVRRLGEDLGINLHTVNKAYALLRDEGYVVMRGRGGARIACPAKTGPGGAQDARDAVRAALAKIAVEFKARGGSASEFEALAARACASVYDENVPGDTQSRA